MNLMPPHCSSLLYKALSQGCLHAQVCNEQDMLEDFSYKAYGIISMEKAAVSMNAVCNMCVCAS